METKKSIIRRKIVQGVKILCTRYIIQDITLTRVEVLHNADDYNALRTSFVCTATSQDLPYKIAIECVSEREQISWQ